MKPPFPHFRSIGASDRSIDALAAEWVVRRDDGLNETGKMELAAWLAANPAHEQAFARLARTWAVFDRAGQSGQTSEIVTRLAVRARKRYVAWRNWLAVGSAAAVLVVLWRGGSIPAAPVTAPIVAMALDHTEKLPDGTLVELNQAAEIVVQYEPNVRRVQLLRGEALFHVQKDPARPFLVRAGAIEVRAVGTAFNVQFQPSSVEVLVTEGKVRVTDVARGASLLPSPRDGGAQPVDSEDQPLLVAGQRALLDARQPERLSPSGVVTLAPAEIEERLAWRIPMVQFSGTELSEAVRIFNRQNLLQISFHDPAVGTLHVSGSFRSDNPEGFLRLLEKTFGLVAIHQNENAVVLNRAPISRPSGLR